MNIVQRNLRRALRARGNNWGARVALAREIGVSGPFLSMVLAGKKRPGPKVLTYLGLEAFESYRVPRLIRSAPGRTTLFPSQVA